MLKLPEVTAIALTGINLDEHKRVLDLMCKDIEFGAAKIIWDENIKSVDDWNRKIVYDLWKYIDTSHCFLFHADGVIENPHLWNPKWLEYDYCGAPWPLPQDDYSYRDPFGNIQRVGNSVGLRSRKLLKLPTDLNLEWKSYYGNTNEDGFFSVHNRYIFEKHGCKFMPFEEALRFGKEAPLPENEGLKTFCTHLYA
jgi:hypothetical protein